MNELLMNFATKNMKTNNISIIMKTLFFFGLSRAPKNSGPNLGEGGM